MKEAIFKLQLVTIRTKAEENKKPFHLGEGCCHGCVHERGSKICLDNPCVFLCGDYVLHHVFVETVRCEQ